MLICFICTAQSKEGLAELQKIRSFYASAQLKRVAGQMRLTNGSGKLVDKVDFEYWLKETMVFTRMNYMEILRNGQYYVMVNNKSRTIYARPVTAQGDKVATGFFDVDQLQQLLNGQATSIRMENGATSTKKLTIDGVKDSRFSSFSIVYSPVDYHIIRVVASVRSQVPGEPMTLQIDYSLTEKDGEESKSLFSINRYASYQNGKLTFHKNYQDYQKL
jgi:hypothetical protein